MTTTVLGLDPSSIGGISVCTNRQKKVLFVPTCTYSTTLSSPTSLLAVTFVAGKALGTMFSKTLRREFVMVKEVIVTEAERGQ